MALDRSNRYPGRFENPTTASPQGAFKNRTSPTAQDGSYFEADWANDWDGFFGRLLTLAGITPNSDVDTAQNSQYYDALKSLFLQRTDPFGDIKADGAAAVKKALENLGLVTNGNVGRLINIQTPTVSGTYTPTTGTKFVIAKLQAAGGNGANAAATAIGQVACGTGGSAGAYAEFMVNISDITNFNFTIGLHAASSSSATQGGSTSFCGVTCTGGWGSAFATVTSSFPVQSKANDGGTVKNAGTTPLVMLKSRQGSPGGSSLATVLGNSLSGRGGDSEFSVGANSVGGGSSNGIDALYGAGGSGANGVSNPTGGFSGGLGGNGLIQFWEYA